VKTTAAVPKIDVPVPRVWATNQMTNAAYRRGYHSGLLGAFPPNPYDWRVGVDVRRAWDQGHIAGMQRLKGGAA
jgi:hypothetical protein